MLTLFAMVLAVGTVVDDAIVVIENVQRHMEAGDEPRVATQKTMEEVGFVFVTGFVFNHFKTQRTKA